MSASSLRRSQKRPLPVLSPCCSIRDRKKRKKQEATAAAAAAAAAKTINRRRLFFPGRRMYSFVSATSAYRSRSDCQRRPRALRRALFLLSPADSGGGSAVRSRRLSPGTAAAVTAAATGTTAAGTPGTPGSGLRRSHISPGLGERARLPEGGVLPHQGRVVHERRLPAQLLLARAAAAAAVRAVNLGCVRRRRRQQPRGPLPPGLGLARRR